MRTIYSHQRYRRRSITGLVCALIFFGLYTVMAVMGLVFAITTVVSADARPDHWILVVAPVLTGLGAWGLFWHIRFFVRTPIDISILGSGLVQFRMRRGEETVSPRAFTVVIFTRGGASSDHLRVKTGAQSWFLPSDDAEAEDLIRTLTALNPNIRVKRREESSD